MASDINPSLTPTKSLVNFRFWCQKVLPLVYDDSLSYYEVLGKMVAQLNDVIDDVNADTENVLTLKDAFLALQTYVNEFFDDIDQLASYAERAEDAQTAANQSAINAASSASNASASSIAAMNARDAAVSAKEAAEASASTASTAATNANTKASEAAQSAITAQTAQASASQSATLAATDRIAAQTAATTATAKASEASESATNAETSATNAEQSKDEAEALVNKMQESLVQVNEMSIEGYEWAVEEQNGNYIDGYICNNNGGQSAVANFSNTEYAVNEGDECYITGTGNPAFVVLDASNNVLYRYQPGSNLNITNYRYIAPVNTAKIFVNRRFQRPVLKITQPFKFVPTTDNPNVIGRKTANTIYSAGKKFVTEFDLTGSLNESVSYRSLLNNNASFKTVNDDISPVRFLNANFIGANHGYNFAYKCTANNHGLVESDIGKTYQSNGNTWVLIKIDDENTFEIVCLDETVWWKAKTATVPSTINFGTEITITSNSLSQIRPSIKNIKTEILGNNSAIFRILENYDIIDLSTGLTNLIQNVGNNTNDSLVELADSVCSVNNVYDTNEYGAITLYTQINLLKAVMLDEYTGTQCQAFAATSDLFAVLGTNFPTLQSSVKSARVGRWNDANKAPSIFIKSNADKSKAFVVAYINDRTDVIANTAGEVDSSTLKLYPYLVNKQADTVRSYGNIALRIPLVKNETGADYVGYATVGDDIYYFIGLLSAKTVSIIPEANVFGKTITVVEANNITVNNNNIINTIDITSSGEGYCLLKIS